VKGDSGKDRRGEVKERGGTEGREKEKKGLKEDGAWGGRVGEEGKEKGKKWGKTRRSFIMKKKGYERGKKEWVRGGRRGRSRKRRGGRKGG